MNSRHEPTFLISKNLRSDELDKVKKPNKIGFPFPSKNKNFRKSWKEMSEIQETQ